MARRDTEETAKFVVPTSSTDTRLASDVLYDHVDPGTLVIAIEAIYLDPRAK